MDFCRLNIQFIDLIFLTWFFKIQVQINRRTGSSPKFKIEQGLYLDNKLEWTSCVLQLLVRYCLSLKFIFGLFSPTILFNQQYDSCYLEVHSTHYFTKDGVTLYKFINLVFSFSFIMSKILHICIRGLVLNFQLEDKILKTYTEQFGFFT